MSIKSALVLLLFCTSTATSQAATNVLLTNAVDVLALPGTEAWGMSVVVRGVVTAVQPATQAQPNWDGRFFVQDATAGVFAEDSSHRRPEPGDLVEVTGVSHPGGFAPFISYAQWTKFGTAQLPPAKLVAIEQLMAGVDDSQRVEIAGIVRAFREDPPLVVYEVAVGGYRLRAYSPSAPDLDPASLIGAWVRVRGTASTLFSGQLRQLISVELHVPTTTDFIVEKRQPGDPFHAPLLPLNSLGQYRLNRELGEQVHVKGMVTYQRLGEDLFIQDATSGLQIKTRQTELLVPGDTVEAVGFLAFDRFLPVLEDGTFRKTAEPRQALEPKATPIWELHAGYRHADLVRLRGKVLDQVERAREEGGRQAEFRTILTLQNEGVVFTVEGFSPEPNRALSAIPVGSTLEVDGICYMHIGEDGKLQALQLLLPAASSLRVLEKPDWLTPERLLVGLALLGIVLLVAVSWIVMVQKRNLALKISIQEKTKAQRELQQSHDLLEWRVAERSKQLKVEMTARKEAEVQFKATLTERTRLAQELHDTLEQSLTGIGLQVDTAARLVERDVTSSKRHLGLARNLMSQTQTELRRSIWDLRSRELEEFDFPNAMRINAQQILEGTSLRLKVETKGTVRPLSEVTEENLLRISQAALNNVIKHAEASQVEISLEFSRQELAMRIVDNGRGFIPVDCPGSAEGHFGLVGMSERTRRLDGEFHVTSALNQGTRLEVRIPLRPPNTRGTAAESAGPL